MIPDIYVDVANSLMDIADKKLEEASKIVHDALKIQEEAEWYLRRMDESVESGEVREVIWGIKKKCKITWDDIAKNKGENIETARSKWHNRGNKMSVYSAAKWAKGVEADLCMIDREGDIWKIEQGEWKPSKGGYSSFRFAPYIKKHLEEIQEGDAEIWFQ